MSVILGLLLGFVIPAAMSFGAAWYFTRPLPEAKRVAERWAEMTNAAADEAQKRGPAI